MNDRVAAATLSPHTLALAEVVQMLGRHTQRDDLRPAVEPSHDAVPAWLRDRLIHTAGIDGEVVDAMTGEHAMERWERFITSRE